MKRLSEGRTFMGLTDVRELEAEIMYYSVCDCPTFGEMSFRFQWICSCSWAMIVYIHIPIDSLNFQSSLNRV